MFWSWRSDASHSYNGGEKTMILFGVPAYKFHSTCRFGLSLRLQLDLERNIKGAKGIWDRDLADIDDEEGNEKT